MKKNAILVAAILFVAGCAHQRSYQRASYDTDHRYYSTENPTYGSTDVIVRDSEGRMIAPSDSGVAAQYDTSRDFSASYDSSNTGHIMADSSKRGGSMEARGYSRDLNEHEVMTHPMNPAYEADSSVRGGSTAGRNSEWNTRPEPSSGYGDTHIKADSSVRGGSMKARGYDRFSSNYSDENDHTYSYDSGVSPTYESNSATWNDDAAMENDLRSDSDLGQGGYDVVIIERGSIEDQDQVPLTNQDFGQGGSERSDVKSSNDPNFNPSDDLLPDNQQNRSDESVGGAAGSSVGTGSSRDNLETSKSNLDDIDIQSTSDDSAQKRLDQSSTSDEGSAERNAQLNGSPNLEKNISGEFDLRDQDSSTGLQNSSDISSGVSDAAGAAATSETGSSSSSSIDNNDASVSGSVSSRSSALPDDNSRINSNSPNWLMQDNRALGVGSNATGEQGSALSSDSTMMSNDQLAQQVKAELTKSTGVNQPLPSDLARNIMVTSHGGVVTLKGTVPSQKDKDVISIRAREVKGVNRVDNQLRVNPQSDSEYRDLTKGHDLEERTDQIQP